MMIDTNGTGRIEQMNQGVRAFCVIVLIVTFCAAFLWGVWREKPIVSIEAFVGVLTFAMTWWFKSKDEERARAAQATTTTTTTPVPGEPGPIKTVTTAAPSDLAASRPGG